MMTSCKVQGTFTQQKNTPKNIAILLQGKKIGCWFDDVFGMFCWGCVFDCMIAEVFDHDCWNYGCIMMVS